MRLVGARPETFACVGAILKFYLFVWSVKYSFSLHSVDALGHCWMQGLNRSAEKSGSAVLLPRNKKILANSFPFFFKNGEFSHKNAISDKIFPFLFCFSTAPKFIQKNHCPWLPVWTGDIASKDTCIFSYNWIAHPITTGQPFFILITSTYW